MDVLGLFTPDFYIFVSFIRATYPAHPIFFDLKKKTFFSLNNPYRHPVLSPLFCLRISAILLFPTDLNLHCPT